MSRKRRGGVRLVPPGVIGHRFLPGHQVYERRDGWRCARHDCDWFVARAQREYLNP